MRFPPTRRDSLIFGTLAGLGAVSSCPSLALGDDASAEMNDTSFASAKRCILIWLDGGPSHLETFDPKPQAPQEVRGPLGVIATKHAGIHFGEGLPELASRTDQFCVIRSMTSPVGEHNLATKYALSGHIPGGRAAAPAFTLPVAELFHGRSALPTHIAVPDFNLGGGSELQGFWDSNYLPWSLGTQPSDPQFMSELFPVPNGMNVRRLDRRRELLERNNDSSTQSLQRAIDLLSQVSRQRAFDVQQETSATRQRYGAKPIGQNCLLARRLIEAGVPLVTVNNKGWDTHDRLHERLHAGYTGAKIPVGLVPSMDQAVASLLDDLQTTGLISETLVVVMGEFGRTPKINTQGGRDHWPRAYSVLLAGAGVKSGTIYGSSDRVGENADEDPVTPADLVATIYHLLGISPHQRVATPDGQQMSRVPEQAEVVADILA
ncbi:MAG: DUF1501 domain-containing protein [Planctomycetales bacterium]|nr:DUF1501 domain-containing protein [Planctomycetales bacterium]